VSLASNPCLAARELSLERPMASEAHDPSRRHLLKASLGVGALALLPRRAAAAGLPATPQQTEGPF
jgi:hypothetical protein